MGKYRNFIIVTDLQISTHLMVADIVLWDMVISYFVMS